MRRLTPILFAAAAAAPAALAAETTILPGYWESTNRLISPVRSSSVERRCITPADVDKFLAGPSNRHYACTYPNKSIGGGRIAMKGSCVSKKGRRVAVSGEGSYTPTSFYLEATVATTFFGIPIAGRASTNAHRISDSCPEVGAVK